MNAFLEDAKLWSAGKWWIPRALLLVYLVYNGIKYIADPNYSDFFGGIIFGIHELGHVLFSVAGEFMMFAGGTITQLAAPIATIYLFYRQREYFGISVALAWLGFSFFSMATYLADARSMQLPLLGLTDDPQHDWNYLLGIAGLLEQDALLAGITRFFATVSWFIGIVFGGWLCYEMASDRKRQKA